VRDASEQFGRRVGGQRNAVVAAGGQREPSVRQRVAGRQLLAAGQRLRAAGPRGPRLGQKLLGAVARVVPRVHTVRKRARDHGRAPRTNAPNRDQLLHRQPGARRPSRRRCRHALRRLRAGEYSRHPKELLFYRSPRKLSEEMQLWRDFSICVIPKLII